MSRPARPELATRRQMTQRCRTLVSSQAVRLPRSLRSRERTRWMRRSAEAGSRMKSQLRFRTWLASVQAMHGHRYYRQQHPRRTRQPQARRQTRILLRRGEGVGLIRQPLLFSRRSRTNTARWRTARTAARRSPPAAPPHGARRWGPEPQWTCVRLVPANLGTRPPGSAARFLVWRRGAAPHRTTKLARSSALELTSFRIWMPCILTS
mmetsp:Transcript_20672/g.46812  ORF Transcript_20672/g.46812 Transcript_20672/m.46812 type:complete len:208 (-) Transcript_20672:144-767(-)